MEIVKVAPGDVARLRSVWEIETAANVADLPEVPPDPVEDVLNDPPVQRAKVRERWLARDRDEPVGTAKITLPQLDNTGVMELSIVVHPQARRRGIGRALLDVALRRAREEGRTSIIGEIPQRLVNSSSKEAPGASPGVAFATAAGAKEALAEMCRVLDLDALDESRLQALETEATARADGYGLVQWAGRAPDELLPDLARLTSRMSTDAPLGDLVWEEENWDAERYREAEEEALALDRVWITTAVRHLESGRLVGYTDIGVSIHQPQVAHQWTTIVDAAHRGHRLGMLIKVGNVRLLRREHPAARRIFTWNADSNEHMLAINKAMGFRPVARWCEWQLHLT